MRTRHSLPMIAATLALMTMSAACGDADSPASSETPVSGTAVAVVDNDFEPPALQVEAGDTVTWTWEGSKQHDVAFDDVASEVQSSGTWTRTFDDVGEYDYACSVHSAMRGTIVVTES